MSEINETAYGGDAEDQRKAAELVASKCTLIWNILKFLNASPTSLFDCPPKKTEDLGQFYEENFEACISCTMATDETIRDLARKLCERLMSDTRILGSLRKSVAINAKGFLGKFWKLTYVKVAHLRAKSES